MCRRVECPKCGKPTFAGCGMHVEQVLGNVPKDQRCKCAEEAQASGAQPQGGGGFFSKLFGR
jgi:hypothetical protein